jgi:hypothetical protein
MARRLLVILFLVLVALVLLGTLGRVRRSLATRPLATAPAGDPRVAARPPAAPPGPHPVPGRMPHDTAPAADTATRPSIVATAGLETILPAPPGTRPLDRLVRLGVRRRLRAEGQRHYLDSLLAVSDSTIRRWPADSGPLPIALVSGGPAGWRPAMGDLVRAAFAAWRTRELGLALAEVSDTAQARVVVRWVDRFPTSRTGETSLTWDRAGRVHQAEIRLAINDSTGAPLPTEALRIVALHEAGHALGLSHSAERTDVMFPSASVPAPSERDLFSLRLLYDLPLGSIRDSL